MLTYAEAHVLFQTARDKDAGKPLENNTRLIQFHTGDVEDLPAYGIKLHDTVIVRIYPDGDYRLTSGGWRTKLTAERITSYSPVCISSVKREWVVNAWTDKAVPFTDGMLVTADTVRAVILRMDNHKVYLTA